MGCAASQEAGQRKPSRRKKDANLHEESGKPPLSTKRVNLTPREDANRPSPKARSRGTNSRNPLAPPRRDARVRESQPNARVHTNECTLSSISTTPTLSTHPQSLLRVTQSSSASHNAVSSSNGHHLSVSGEGSRRESRRKQDRGHPRASKHSVSKRGSRAVRSESSPASLSAHTSCSRGASDGDRSETASRWRRTAESAASRRNKLLEGLSGAKLARIQRWIDFSDHGTSPLGPLLDPQDAPGQRDRERRMMEMVRQGVPLYAQNTSVAAPVSPSLRESRRAVGQVGFRGTPSTCRAGAQKLRSRVSTALAKAKRRQSSSWRPGFDGLTAAEQEKAEHEEAACERGISTDLVVAVNASNNPLHPRCADEDAVDHNDDTSEPPATGSMANFDGAAEAVSNAAMLDAESVVESNMESNMESDMR